MKNHITHLLRGLFLSLFAFWASFLPAASLALPLFPTQPIQDTIKPTSVDSSEFLLQGIARSGDTGKNFDHIYIDVYKILADGSVELIRADRFPNGEFDLWLRRNERYMLLMNYDNRAYLEGLLNPEDAIIENNVLHQIFILDEYRPDLLVQQEELVDTSSELMEEPETMIPIMVADTADSPIEVAQTLENNNTPEIISIEAEDTRSIATASEAKPRQKEPTPEKVVPTETEKTIEVENKSSITTVPEAKPLQKEPVQEKAVPMETEKLEVLGTFVLNESTSFRKEATHLSDVILRFNFGDEVELLEKTNKYWWKVRFKKKIGWVKAAKLQENWF